MAGWVGKCPAASPAPWRHGGFRRGCLPSHPADWGGGNHLLPVGTPVTMAGSTTTLDFSQIVYKNVVTITYETGSDGTEYIGIGHHPILGGAHERDHPPGQHR